MNITRAISNFYQERVLRDPHELAIVQPAWIPVNFRIDIWPGRPMPPVPSLITCYVWQPDNFFRQVLEQTIRATLIDLDLFIGFSSFQEYDDGRIDPAPLILYQPSSDGEQADIFPYDELIDRITESFNDQRCGTITNLNIAFLEGITPEDKMRFQKEALHQLRLTSNSDPSEVTGSGTYNELREMIGLQLQADLETLHKQHSYQEHLQVCSHPGFSLAVRRFGRAIRFVSVFTPGYEGLYQLCVQTEKIDENGSKTPWVVFRTQGKGYSSDWQLKPGNNPFTVLFYHLSTKIGQRVATFTLVGRDEGADKENQSFEKFAEKLEELATHRAAAEERIKNRKLPPANEAEALKALKDAYEEQLRNINTGTGPFADDDLRNRYED